MIARRKSWRLMTALAVLLAGCVGPDGADPISISAAPVTKGGAGFRRKKNFIGVYRPEFSLWFPSA